MTRLASEYIRYKYSDEEYESGSGPDASGPNASGPDASGPDASGPDASGPDAMGTRPQPRPDPRGIRPRPDPRDIEIPIQEDCSCGQKKTRAILIFFLHRKQTRSNLYSKI
jgi:hypothetical protein